MNLRAYLEKNGGQTAFAKKLKVSQGLVWQWLNGETRITAERAVQIEAVTDGLITRNELRPDLYAPETPMPKRRPKAGAVA